MTRIFAVFVLALFATSLSINHNVAAQTPGNNPVLEQRLEDPDRYWTEVWSLHSDTGLQFTVGSATLNPAIFAAVTQELLPLMVEYTSRPECEVRLVGETDRHLNGGSNDPRNFVSFSINESNDGNGGREMGLSEARAYNSLSTAAWHAEREVVEFDPTQIQIDPSPKERSRGVVLYVHCELTLDDVDRRVDERLRELGITSGPPNLAQPVSQSSSVTADFDITQLNRNSFRFTSSARFTGCTDPQYNWEVNGFEREGRVIQNVFDVPGQYAVTHRVTCDDREDTVVTKYVTVLPPEQTSSTRDLREVGGGDGLSSLSLTLIGGQAKDASVPRDASSPPPASCSLCGTGELESQDESGPSGPVKFYGAGLIVHQRFTDVIGGSLTVGGVGGQVETDEGNFSQLFGYVGGGLTAFLDSLINVPVNAGIDGALLVNQEGITPAIALRAGIDL